MRRLFLVILVYLSAMAMAQDPNEQPAPVMHPTSRRVKIDYSPEAVAARREAEKQRRAERAVEQKARREKILAERANRKPPPAAVKKPAFGRPFFLFGGIMMLAMAAVITVYGKFLKGS